MTPQKTYTTAVFSETIPDRNWSIVAVSSNISVLFANTFVQDGNNLSLVSLLEIIRLATRLNFKTRYRSALCGTTPALRGTATETVCCWFPIEQGVLSELV